MINLIFTIAFAILTILLVPMAINEVRTERYGTAFTTIVLILCDVVMGTIHFLRWLR